PLCRASETGRRFASRDRRSKKTRAGVQAGQDCAPPAESAKVPTARPPEPSKRCTSREKRSQKTIRESATIGKSNAGRIALHNHNLRNHSTRRFSFTKLWECARVLASF